MKAAKDYGEIKDVKVEISLRLGRTEKSLEALASMGEGTIVELDSMAGDAVDVLVEGKLVAKAEVVVVDENFGFRVVKML
jgi:flagellar motor switch protein FliN/FliY